MCAVCVACLLIPLYPLCGCRCVSCVLPFPLVPLPPLTYVDAKALCQAAGSLKKLKLKVDQSRSSEALAEVFGHRPLEELGITPLPDVEVSSACSPQGVFHVRAAMLLSLIYEYFIL